MDIQQMIDQLNLVTAQLEYADNARPTDDGSRVAIGALIIAVDHLREVVVLLVEKYSEIDHLSDVIQSQQELA